ncbi:hypothetical protein [Moraxella canis]|uniref:hypothetical protein n=1 Tax=Moraxella canis TaxID=90239 RepID=UPI000AAFD086|nr:hypothetical protein [Moraxella canis]
MLVQLYIYQKSDGAFLYQDIGNPDYVIADLGDDKDFTLTPPPDFSKQWRWVDGEWI